MVATPTPADLPAAAAPAAEEPALPLDLVELELALDGLAVGEAGFAATLRKAAAAIGGEFLFELPASGLAEDCRRIAALRMPDDGADGPRVVFALLAGDGATIRLEEPGERTDGLRRFAEAFIAVLERI